MRRLGTLLGLCFLACSTGQAIAPARLPLEATGTASRVVLVSFDGLGADALGRICADCPGFNSIAAGGLRVDRVVPVTPSATTSAHVAILTGADPNVTGIVGNRFHLPGTPWTQVAEGFVIPIDAETIVEVARRNGKRVGSIAFPTVDARSPRRTADFYLQYVQPVARARMVRLSRSDFRPTWTPPGWTSQKSCPSFSPVMRARIDWSIPDLTRQDVDIVACDTTDDQRSNYDAVFISTQESEVQPDARGWFALAKRHDGALYGSWSKVLRIDPALDSVTIYMGAIACNTAEPAAFREMVDREAGFWPTSADEASAAGWLHGGDGIDANTFAEQTERFGEFLTRVTVLATERMQFDLLLSYQPMIDQTEHQFLIENDRQRNATEANRAAGLQARTRAIAAADRAAAAIARSLDFSRDALVVTGDHGVAAVDTELRLPTLLTQLAVAPQWVAFANGNIGHLYRTGGEDNAAGLRRTLEETGFFERVSLRTPESHPNNGDIVLLAKPNVSLTTRAGELTAQPWYYGQHGGLGSTPSFHTLLFARGAGVPAGRIGEIRQTDIAPFLASLLGIERAGAIVSAP